MSNHDTSWRLSAFHITGFCEGKPSPVDSHVLFSLLLVRISSWTNSPVVVDLKIGCSDAYIWRHCIVIVTFLLAARCDGHWGGLFSGNHERHRTAGQIWRGTWWRHQIETFSALLALWRGALVLSLICARINAWVYNREAGDLRRYPARYDVIVMKYRPRGSISA